jgi:tyrosinase
MTMRTPKETSFKTDASCTTSFSRRALLQGSAAVGALSLAGGTTARAAGPKTRHSAFSPEGKKALASYAKAVEIMRNRSRQDPADPLGWTYQYKIHWYPDHGDTLVLPDGSVDFAALQRDQIAELDAFFGPPGPTNTRRTQAEATWGKCPHSNSSTIALDFMPWHRKYLFCFELIVRKLSGDDDFALPYWGYMDGKTSQVLPPEFDAIGSPLRNARSPKSSQGDPMTLSFFGGRFWSDRTFAVFSRAAEGTPHGSVHNFVGAGDHDMSSLFRSPRDPVFWLHHCEIDRIWEGAMKAGFQPPAGAWLNNKHQFFDESGKLVELTNKDVLKTELIKDLPGYVYQTVPQPPAAPPIAVAAQAPEAGPRRALAAAANIAVRGGMQTTVMVVVAPLDAASLAADGTRRIKLEISDVTLDRRAAAEIGLYVNAPADATGETLRKYEVGILSTFGILPGAGPTHAGHAADGPPNVQSFDVTDVVVQLQREGRWSGEPRLTTVEITGSLGNSVLRLGKVELIETGAQ